MELLKAPRSGPAQPATPQYHYQIQRLLGEGGYAQVFEAWDGTLCRSVALKRLRAAADGAQTEQLRREARLTASLRHQAFVQIYTIDEASGEPAIVMELVNGVTLRQRLQDGPIDLHAALDIIFEVADAMAEAHASGLVHGDIKPSNLMLDAAGRIRILDLGLARHIDPLQTHSSITAETQGTIAYMAPERLMGRPSDTGSDIYSLGMVLYEMLAGQRPFAGLNGLALATAHMQATPQLWPLPEALPPGVVTLVRELTASQRHRRPASMRQLADLIGPDREHRPLLTAPVPIQAPQAAHRRRPGWLALAGVGTAGACVVAAALISQHLPPRAPVAAASAVQSEASATADGLRALLAFDVEHNQQLAIKAFSEALSQNPANATASAGLALTYSLRYTGGGRDPSWLKRAEASAQLALRQDDHLALAHVAQSWVAEFQGRADAAHQASDAALRLDPRNLMAYYGKIRMHIRARQYEQAQALLARADQLYPNSRLFSTERGLLFHIQGDQPAAERAFRRSIALDPTVANSYAYLSSALSAQNRGDEALQVLQQGLQFHPDWELYANLGDALFKRGDYLGALYAFETALSADKGNPNYYLGWANLGDAQRWLPGEAANAARSYRRAVSLLQPLAAQSPNDPLFASRLALYLARSGNVRAALEQTRHALQLAPDAPDVLFRAAVALQLSGQSGQALDALTRSVTLGYSLSHIEAEPDLLPLRRHARYQHLTMERPAK